MPAFRTNKELLSHCEVIHHEKLGILNYHHYLIQCIARSIMAHVINACLQGLKTLSFTSMREFLYWKEREEEATYSSYTKGQQTYNPSSSGRCILRVVMNQCSSLSEMSSDNIISTSFNFQMLMLAITSPAAVLANIMVTKIQGRQQKNDPTRRNLES